jgi:hypothetical protein
MTLPTLWQGTCWSLMMGMCISNALKKVLRASPAFMLTARCYKRDVNIMQKVQYTLQVTASVRAYNECLNLVSQKVI